MIFFTGQYIESGDLSEGMSNESGEDDMRDYGVSLEDDVPVSHSRVRKKTT